MAKKATSKTSDTDSHNGMQSGPMSRAEEIEIIKLLDTHTDEQIADIYRRRVDKIKSVRATAATRTAEMQYENIIMDLERKFFWVETLAQLLSNEVEYFQKYWASLVYQFSNSGIVATDELMMRDLILLDIHLNRANKNRKAVAEELQDIDSETLKVMAETKDDYARRVMLLQPLQDRSNALRSASKALNEEAKNIQEKKDKKYEQLKGTREMRLDKAEKSGTNFYELVKHLDTPEIRQQEGRLNELYKIAVEIAKLEYSAMHKFGNDTYDNPLLTPETVLQEKQNENSSNNGS